MTLPENKSITAQRAERRPNGLSKEREAEADVDAHVLSVLLPAIRNPYQMTDEDRALVVADARRVLRDPKASDKAKSGASKVMLACDELNMRKAEIVQKVLRLNAGEATERVEWNLGWTGQRRPDET